MIVYYRLSKVMLTSTLSETVCCVCVCVPVVAPLHHQNELRFAYTPALIFFLISNFFTNSKVISFKHQTEYFLHCKKYISSEKNNKFFFIFSSSEKVVKSLYSNYLLNVFFLNNDEDSHIVIFLCFEVEVFFRKKLQRMVVVCS